MTIAGAFARPDEALRVAQKVRAVVEVDPVAVLVGEEDARSAGCGIDEEQVEGFLIAAEALDGKLAGIGCPVDARQITRPGAVEIDWMARAAAHRLEEQANYGQRSARQRIDDGVLMAVGGAEIVLSGGVVVGLEVGDPGGIGRPPVGGAEAEFVAVGPVRLAFAEIGGAGQRKSARGSGGDGGEP